jgi:DNA adenine methylase
MALNAVRPIIKWAGGKQSLAGTLVSMFPDFEGRYFEPFMGGASVLLTLAPSVALVGDENRWLTDTYRAVIGSPDLVSAQLDKLVNTEEEYYKNRSIDPNDVSLIERAALFIYLNKTCFRGLYRVNKKNRFNVPYGAYNRKYHDLENLRSFSRLAKNWIINTGDFSQSIKGIKKDDFVYFDPPYYKLGGYSDFNRYTDGKFMEHDHIRLAEACLELDAKGIKFAVSNSRTEFIADLFSKFNCIKIDNRREINLNVKGRTVNELFITNYEIES